MKIELTQEEALILFDWLYRNSKKENTFRISKTFAMRKKNFALLFLSVRHLGIQAFVYAGQPIYWMLRHTRMTV